jgi:hypothetical protein
MGFGRSGTSLMGGILHQAGYYMGEDLYPPRISNPMGFFENAVINRINERILAQYDYCLRYKYWPPFEKKWSPFNPGEGHRWLSYIPEDIEIVNTPDLIGESIKQILSRSGFAYKDPRFNYTLFVWEPYLSGETLFICLFREPEITIRSVLIECETAEYLSDFAITQELSENLWINSYLHLLKKMDTINPNRFIFIHYQQLLTGEIIPYLSDILQVKLDHGFINPNLNRTPKGLTVSDKTINIYRKLCDLALFEPK